MKDIFTILGKMKERLTVEMKSNKDEDCIQG